MSDWLAHYGRKGMKWHKHIFGKEASSKGRFVDGEYKRESDYNSQKNNWGEDNRAYDNGVGYASYVTKRYASEAKKQAAQNVTKNYNHVTLSSLSSAVHTMRAGRERVRREQKVSNVVAVANKKYRKNQIESNNWFAGKKGRKKFSSRYANRS